MWLVILSAGQEPVSYSITTPAQPVGFLQHLFDLLRMADASSAVVMALIATSAMLYGLTQTFQRRELR